MAGLRAIRATASADPAQLLYERIGAFLRDQRLDPNPANYAFAWHLLADPDGPLARAVANLTDGGVRLTQRDIESLGVENRPVAGTTNVAAAKADGLVARTQMQVEGFADMLLAIRAETEGFGRDLAASADAIRRTRDTDDSERQIDQVGRLTAAMLDRVHTAESRLESATREASELREELERARDNARRDPLTALPNRRAIEEAFAGRDSASAPFCLAVCDVDHFKSVNDRFGHAVGDRVLKAIAEVLVETCGGHFVGRYGGEEFAVLFRGLDAEGAQATLDTVRVSVAAKRYRLRESDAPLGEITFSAGLTQIHTGDSFHSAFQRADALLYAAKDAGRNRVHRG